MSIENHLPFEDHGAEMQAETTPGFGVEPGADEPALKITITEADKVGLRAYIADMRESRAIASRRTGARATWLPWNQ